MFVTMFWLSFLVNGNSCADPASPVVEIIAHRGASHDAPENTLRAVKLAWEQDADAVEFDVRLSKDGKIVLMHDKTTKRTAGVNKNVVDQTLDELRKLDVGSWKGPEFAGEKVPTLAEVLATVPAKKRVFIEIKCGPEIVPALQNVLNIAKLKPQQTAVISFSSEVVAAVKKAMPKLQVYWVVSRNKEKARPPTAAELIAKVQAIKANGLDLSATPVFNRGFAAKIRSAELRLSVWTVNDPDLAQRLMAAGVEGITTDRPGWLRQQLPQ